MVRDMAGFLFFPARHCRGELMLWLYWLCMWLMLAVIVGGILTLIDTSTAVTESVGPAHVIGRSHTPGYFIHQTTYISDGKTRTPITTLVWIPPSWSLSLRMQSTGEALSADVSEGRYGTPDGAVVTVTRGRTRLFGRLIVTGIE